MWPRALSKANKKSTCSTAALSSGRRSGLHVHDVGWREANAWVRFGEDERLTANYDKELWADGY